MGQGKALKGFLVERDGQREAFIGAEGGDKPIMALFSGGEYPFISAGLHDDQPGIKIREVGNSKPLALLGSSTAGNGQLVLSGTEELVRLGGTGDRGQVLLSEGGKPSVSLGPTAQKASTAVRVYSKGSMVFAAGATGAGEGAVVVLSKDHVGAGMEAQGNNGRVYVMSGATEVASINSTDKPNEGMAVIRNSAGLAVAKLGYGTAGGGNIQVTNPAGEGVFSAGYASDGAGEACVFRYTQAGTGRNACIGLGLPSAGMGK